MRKKSFLLGVLLSLFSSSLCVSAPLREGFLASGQSPTVTRLTRTYFPKAFLSYSPDGSHLIYSRHHANRRASNKILVGLRIVRADGSGDRPLLPDFDHLVQLQEHAAFAPDGKTLLLTGVGNNPGQHANDTIRADLSRDLHASNLPQRIPS